MTKTQAHGCSFESTQRELSNEYQHDRVQIVFKSLCILVHWTKVVFALEGSKPLMPTVAKRSLTILRKSLR